MHQRHGRGGCWPAIVTIASAGALGTGDRFLTRPLVSPSPHADLKPLAMPSKDSHSGAKRAREARSAMGLDAKTRLGCLLTVVEERARLPVVVTGLPDDVAGACYRDGGGAVLWVNGSPQQGHVRRRFTLAHELGHAWCGHDGALEIDTFATLSGKTSTPYEVQANAFAAEFLVPRDALDEVVTREPTLEEAVIIAAHYGVSAIMVVYRFKTLGLASDARIALLEREVKDGLHHEVSARLGLPKLEDRLGAIDHLPYLSPALEGTALAAGLRGDTAVSPRVARAIGRLLV
jgi:Zn-dependent peptidase ImmA (M78 family)